MDYYFDIYRWHRQRQSQAQGMMNTYKHTQKPGPCPLITFEALNNLFWEIVFVIIFANFANYHSGQLLCQIDVPDHFLLINTVYFAKCCCGSFSKPFVADHFLENIVNFCSG